MTAGPPNEGVLVVLEGIDGSGKSTLARGLVRRFRARGVSVATLREPSNPRIARVAARASSREPGQAALWFTLDRALARRRVDQVLAKVALAIQDRSYFSTLAYQGSALPRADRTRLNSLQESVARIPDLVLLLDVDADVALARLPGRRRVRAPLERLEVLRRAAAAYRRLARPPSWMVLDACEPPLVVLDLAERQIVRLLESRESSRRGTNLPPPRRSLR